MIHEISPNKFNNQFLSVKNFTDHDYIFYYNENSLLLKNSEDDFKIPRRKDFQTIIETTETIFLFTLNDSSCFLIDDCPTVDPDKFSYKEINFFRSYKDPAIAWASIVGFQLMNWYSQNRFCGKCGSKTELKTDERAIYCTTCSHMVFPKISPAIIVAITCNDKILLASNSNFKANWYSLIAGYVDIGESLEETVGREVKEEVGLDVKNIKYYKSQPWPFSGSMMIGFFAEADDKQCVTIDNKEITSAAWFKRGNLPNHPPTLSIAGEMIEKFEKGEL